MMKMLKCQMKFKKIPSNKLFKLAKFNYTQHAAFPYKIESVKKSFN